MKSNQIQLQQNDCQKDCIGLSSNNQHHQPKDTISCIRWSPIMNQNIFACTTWGGELIFYQYVHQQYPVLQMVNYFEHNYPLIAFCWRSDGSQIYIASGDGAILCYNLSNNNGQQQIIQIDQYRLPAVNLFWINQFNALLVVTLEGEIIFYNTDNLSASQPIRQKLEYPVNCCDFNYPVLLIGTMEQKVVIASVDVLVKHAGYKFEYKQSPLGDKSPLKSVGVAPNQKVVAYSSLDGRGNISRLTKKEQYNSPLTYITENIITFKGHKEDRSQKADYYQQPQKFQDLYPINEVAFNIKNENFLATLGSDGKMIYWDYEKKNKITEYFFSGRSISAGTMSFDGNLIAFGLGYDWNEGLNGVGKFSPSINVLRLTDKEIIYRGN